VGDCYLPASLWLRVVKANLDQYEKNCSPSSPKALAHSANQPGCHNTLQTAVAIGQQSVQGVHEVAVALQPQHMIT